MATNCAIFNGGDDKSFKSVFDLVATIFDGGITNRKCDHLLVNSAANK